VTAAADMWAAALARITAGLTTLAQQWETTAADTRTCPHCGGIPVARRPHASRVQAAKDANR
jgi:hypothetical protein